MPLPTLRPTLLVAALGIALTASACGGEPGPPRPRNLLLVTLDTTRADFLGCYGSDETRTPALDRLAREGVRFELALSTSALTPVSHASILTGLPQYRHGLRVLFGDGGFHLPEDVPTLATVLREAGYSTAAFHSAFPVSRYYGFERGFERFEDLTTDVVETGQGPKWAVERGRGQRRADQTTDMVLAHLEELDEPFFLWVHYWDPHDSDIVPPTELVPPGTPRTAGGGYAMTRPLYAAEVSWVDRQFARLRRGLEDAGRWRDTLVAVVADHGEGLDDGQRRHGWPAHRILYQEQIHVPLLLRVPGGPSGRVVTEMVSTVDIAPTLLDYLGVPSPRPVEGLSLRPLLEGGALPPRTVYADAINQFDLGAALVLQRPAADFLHVVADGRWKLIYRPGHPDASELFDVRADPLELHDRYDDEPGVVARLLADLARRDGWVLEPFERAEGGSSPEALRALEQLGYTGSSGGEDGGASHDWRWLDPADGRVYERRGDGPDGGAGLVPVRAGG